MAIAPLRALTGRLLGPRDPRLRVRALGLDVASPLGLAAGFDKDATGFAGLAALGFGFVEVGTITAHGQPGNPRPRVFRASADRALVNGMGFPNEGAEAAAARLARRRPRDGVVGVNVGKTKAASLEEAAADYQATVRRLAPLADYLVLNVSSPNTPGLREMQTVERLTELVEAVRTAMRAAAAEIPLLVKIAPDLSDADLDAIADLALHLQLDGIVAVNTTVDKAVLRATPAALRELPGGVSGAPLKARAVEVLRRLHARTGGKLTLISVGGIETADDAWERIRAGATLVQAYTGFVYGGPLWPRKVNRGLARRVREAGLTSVGQAVGAARAAPSTLARDEHRHAAPAP